MSHGWEFANTPAARVLRAIQMRGKATVKDVAADLGVTASAVRSHLTQLEALGVIRAGKVHEGVGRPHFVYSVMPEAQRLFYRDYGNLARLLLEDVARHQGPAALEHVLMRVADGLAGEYRVQVPGGDLAERVGAWVRLLDQRGVAVKLERTAAGYIVNEYGCPYHSMAIENRAVCEMERQVMARLLGPGVELTGCILDGHEGCQFTVCADGIQRSDEKELA